MKTKLTNIQREFESDDKKIECHLTCNLHLNDLLNCYNIDGVSHMLYRDSRWKTFINVELPKYQGMVVDLNGNHFLINTIGKAICHDDDGFDKKYGEHLAEDRALEKALKIEIRFIDEILNIFNSYGKKLIDLEYNNYQIMNELTKKYLIKKTIMMNFKQYAIENLKGKKLHFKCNCTFPIDMIGIIKDVKIMGSDAIMYVEDDNGKITRITANHPNLMVEEV